MQSEPDARRLIKSFLADVGKEHQEQPVDIVIFSGDLANAGTRDEFDRGRELLLEPLLDLLKIPRSHLVLVPGNHDVDRTTIDEFQEVGLVEKLKDKNSVNKLLAEERTLEQVTQRLSAWRAFVSDFYGEQDAPEPIAPLGHIFRWQINRANVVLAALNTVWRSAGDNDRGRLQLGEHQILRSLEHLDQADIPLVAMHHPLNWLAPWDVDIAHIEFERRPAVVFTGHEHVADPTSETSARGSAIYSRAGCLYESSDYFNGYSLLDLDRENDVAHVCLHEWQTKRGEFDVATRIASGGQVELPWSRGKSVALSGHPAFTTVTAALSERAQQGFLAIDSLPEREVARVEDVLISPRFWPAPFEQVRAAAALSDIQPRPVDPLPALADGKVLIVSGEGESGVTSAQIWLLAAQFDRDATRLPVQVSFRPPFSPKRFEKNLRTAIAEVGGQVGHKKPLPGLLIAVDDLKVERPGAVKGFVRYIAEHRQHRFILGTHEESMAILEAQLSALKLDFQIVHIGPCGRREMRELVTKIAGPEAIQIRDRVIAIIRAQHLPRSPFLITALVVVLASNADVATLNASGVLDSYARLMLGVAEAIDFEGLGMDERRREHLLGWLATQLVRAKVVRIPRLDAEGKLSGYFRDRGWGERISPGRVLQSLIDRHILSETYDGVGFRYPALLKLFAAKAMADDSDFAAEMLAAPLVNADILLHSAGLSRNDRSLLETVAQATREVIAAADKDVSVAMFDLVETRPGWSDRQQDVEHLKAMLAEPPMQVDDEQHQSKLDEIDEQLEWVPHEKEPSTTPTELDELGPAVGTLSNILRSSELVDDIALKAKLVKEALGGWGMVAVIVAIREDQGNEHRKELVESLAGENTLDADAIQRVAEVIMTLIMSLVVTGSLASAHLERVMRLVLDDEEFMSQTAPALFATLLSCELRFPNWSQDLRNLYKRHHSHPIVREITRGYAFVAYRRRRLSSVDESRLESLIADIYTAGLDGVGRNAAARSQVIQELKAGRAKAQRTLLTGNDLDLMA